MCNDSPSWSGRVTKALGGIWTSWRERRAAVAELAGCPGEEVSRMASEFGLSAGELRDLAARGPRAADLLAKRLQALGIAPADAARMEVKKDLERCCSFCDSKRECARDLQTDPQSPAWTQYCPNEPILSELVAMKAPLHAPDGLPQ